MEVDTKLPYNKSIMLSHTAEALLTIDAPDKLIGPPKFHERTGHFLPPENSAVFKKLQDTVRYADTNQMKVNYKKTKLMLFNQCRSIDFLPNFNLGGTELELVEEAKLLGVVVQSDLKWSSNTEHIVKKAYYKL